MDIRVDGERYVAPVRGETFAEILNGVLESVYAAGRGVTRVQIDGESVPFDDVSERLLATPAHEYETVELETERMVTLARRDLDDLDEVLVNLPVFCHTLAELFHKADADEGEDYFEQLHDAWMEIDDRHDAAAEALGIRLVDVEVGGTTARAHRTLVGNQLQLVNEALQKKDRVTASDLLEYELAPLAEAETEITATLHRKLCEAEDAR